MKREENHFRDLDWGDLHRRLLLYARYLFIAGGLEGEMGVLEGFGDGANDLAMEVLRSFIDPDDGSVSWDTRLGKATTSSVFGFLKKILYRDFLDKRRSPRHKGKTNVAEADKTNESTSAYTSPAADAERDCIESKLMDKIHRQDMLDVIQDHLALHPDDEVEEYLILQFLDRDTYAAYKPQEAAEKLDWPVSRVNNVKKKLARLLNQLFPGEGEIGSRANFPKG